jgi:hypothetical protein
MNKIIFYSWRKIVEYNKGDIYETANTFKSFITKPVPKNFLGKSYIINLKDLMECSSSDVEKIEYLLLASLRNYFDYKYQNDAKLYLYFSDISLERISKNKLLTIENDYIKFKYEENHGN